MYSLSVGIWGTGESVGKDLVCCIILWVVHLAWSESKASVDEETDLDPTLWDLTYAFHGTPGEAGSDG